MIRELDPAQLFSDDHPDAVGLSQTNGPHETQYRKDSADGSGPQAERLIMDDQRPEANQEKNPSHQQSKRSELGGIGVVFCAEHEVIRLFFPDN
ncbi:MAG: hypothetical protein R3B83_10735 [Nitrospirales bacterium]|nr:hypothetical protein [Nitrospirales bacterium]